jgi:plasmid stabilization system protein ParE
MSLQLEIGEEAEANLASQYERYCKEATEEVAERYLRAVRETIHRLRTQPGIGSVRKFRRRSLAGIRAIKVDIPFDVYLIFYRYDETVLTVEYVVHGARDLPHLLREEAALYGAMPAGTMAALV